MISIRNLTARVGEFHLRNVSFDVPEGRYGVVIGPAGSGKTTLLEAIAGLTPILAGQVSLGKKDVTRYAPEDRGIGIVYQHGYLFPHLSVRENIDYGTGNGAPAAQEVSERLGIAALADRDVHSLSGGERQLVALARSLARRPPLLLLDEPFSALDPKRRTHARREVRALHREWGFTALQVTHDFTEAGLLGDVAILLDAGRVLQQGPPDEVFRRPATPYIAEFLGAENVLAGTVRVLADTGPDFVAVEEPLPAGALAPGYHALEFLSGPISIYTVGNAEPGSAYAVIRAEEIAVARTEPATSARNVFRGRIVELSTLGALGRVTLDIQGVQLVASLTARSVQELALAEGEDVWASFKAMAVHLC
ncbi:MAG TPA: ABC transporter ATP-binding protein [Gemmatimonadaceae bacterium]|nr:ABC transporter ATP-binding protein [Gemmatimonadaceae bacterium]